ncbi:MAG TPA: hypothetical protein VNK23_03400 [Candidatus Dormibacteraeota bacterium]|nr:hypothetical protein [Candidatus Dormibacteraeota bacterium]
MRSRLPCRLGTALLALVALSTVSAAYQQPLSPESVREAYFLGRHHEQADFFLGRYSQVLSSWSKQLGIVKVQLLTPYAQIVKNSRYDMVNQNSVDIDQEYPRRVLPVIVRVWFNFPVVPDASYVEPDRLARHSSISVSQSHLLRYSNVTYSTLYTGSKRPWPYGVEAELTFSASQFSSAPVSIAISVPGGQAAKAIFDLSQLN